MYTAITQA